MSVTGIASNLCSYALQTLTAQSNSQLFQKDFQQLGKDLQAGNTTAAQKDITALQQLETGSGTSSTNPMAQLLQQMGSDLQAGDLTDAQQLFSGAQQKFQAHHGHHMHGGAGVEQEMQVLGQALQAGNLSSAQQAYSTLQQDLQQFAMSSVSSTASTAADSVSVQA
jgi:hypothetical protein